MKSHLIKINFTGGLISPGELQIILSAVRLAGVSEVSFGLRQVLWVEIPQNSNGLEECLAKLKEHKVFFELDADECPNIISSYPAQEVFIQRNWLSEGIYKDIFDSFAYKPRLKVNIADSEQSFTPMLTGNINWVASEQVNYWYINIRFPKTNQIYTWKNWVDTSDISRMSKAIEQLMFLHPERFIGNRFANGDLLFELLFKDNVFNTTHATKPLDFPPFMLPYYEGFNRYENKLWLGIYRRNEKFPIAFLQDVCSLCLNSQIGLICSTSWKSIIIKNIEPHDRNHWDALLAKHQINVRHAANELNFQIEDHAPEALRLKNELVSHLSRSDMRTFGVCIGIKTQQVGEVFCSILITRRDVVFAGIRWHYVYDIFLAQDFNPNKRTAKIFVEGISQRHLPEYLRHAISEYYAFKAKSSEHDDVKPVVVDEVYKRESTHIVQQCPNCLSIYDERTGIPNLHIPPYTLFTHLPDNYQCECCETPKSQFGSIEMERLFARC